MKILQRKNQGFCPSTARQNLTIAPIVLNFFLNDRDGHLLKVNDYRDRVILQFRS